MSLKNALPENKIKKTCLNNVKRHYCVDIFQIQSKHFFESSDPTVPFSENISFLLFPVAS